MKKTLIIIAFFTLFIKCKEEEITKLNIETVSAIVQADGSVLVRGQITSGNKSSNDEVGFCMSTDPNPEISENQISSVDMNASNFNAVYDDFKLNTKYYFRTWAKNSAGTTLGNVIMVDSIKPEPVVAPCTPPLGKISITGMFGPMGVFTSSQNEDTKFFCDWGDGYVFFSFIDKPRSGIYTSSKETRSESTVYMAYYSRFSLKTTKFEDGAKVYVNRPQSGEWHFTVCQAGIIFAGTTVEKMVTQFDYPE